MLFQETTFPIYRAIGVGIGPGPWFLGAVLGFLLGVVLLVRRRLRILGWCLVGMTLVVTWIGLLTVSECQTQTQLSEFIKARLHTFQDPVRELAQLGMIALPILATLGFSIERKASRARLRSRLTTYVRIANKAFHDSDFDRAISEFSVTLKIDPTQTESHLKRGRAYLEKGDYSRAVSDFDRALVLDPFFAPGFLYRGIARAFLGQHQTAIIDLERAGELDPSDATALLYRGLSLAKIGETARAAEDFRRILKLTNHSDFTEPAKFHLAMLNAEHTSSETAVLPF